MRLLWCAGHMQVEREPASDLLHGWAQRLEHVQVDHGCLDLRIESETEVPVHLVDAPLESVVLGAGHCIESFDALKVMFME